LEETFSQDFVSLNAWVKRDPRTQKDYKKEGWGNGREKKRPKESFLLWGKSSQKIICLLRKGKKKSKLPVPKTHSQSKTIFSQACECETGA